jgi:hypothetical protein
MLETIAPHSSHQPGHCGPAARDRRGERAAVGLPDRAAPSGRRYLGVPGRGDANRRRTQELSNRRVLVFGRRAKWPAKISTGSASRFRHAVPQNGCRTPPRCVGVNASPQVSQWLLNHKAVAQQAPAGGQARSPRRSAGVALEARFLRPRRLVRLLGLPASLAALHHGANMLYNVQHAV